ncbi:class I adenylate-forming enzyme family protein [Aliiglaciecola sp. LCG003]|uniref:class I adenylate-forming enzyme family protein n=1 Tax=Aliiglaciecola sp. LCG003 TaxID=3053655 RepID=UPI002573844F|nr:class I adenylate-forming enzyme family protein [Aliiglaciecola sp. LCG003]WJG08074.1 class I adenylate-forming enzyme family protein [Aliiglaciecola sp. LCG003]
MRDKALEKNLIERVAMGDLLRRRSRDSAHLPALVDFHQGQRSEISYGELNNRVNQLAHGLISNGLKQGDKLALISTNQTDMVVVYFACYKLGVVVVPINFMQSIDDIRYNFEHSESVAIVYQEMFSDMVLALLEGNTSIKLTAQIGNQRGRANFSLDELIDGHSTSEIEDRLIADRDTAHMIYTSGTTSRPKAVESSHLTLTIAALTGVIELDINKQNRMLLVLPLFHCAALSILHPILLRSGCAVLHAAFDPKVIVNSIEQEKIQTAAFLPMMWNALLATPDIDKRDFSHFKTGIYAMAAMNSQNLDKVRDTFGCEMHLGSGQTEFAPVACIYRDNTPTEFAEGNYWGVPVCTAEQAVIDEFGNELPNGQVGEIAWRGPQVMSGYYKNPEASDEATGFGWHHTGDLGLIDSKGQLLFIDRKKDTIKSGGENVSSQKVEQILESFKGVERAASFGVSHPHWGEAVCACVIAQSEVELDVAEIELFCKTQLGKFEVPKAIFICQTLPMTGTGKIRKVELRHQYSDIFATAD